MLIGRTETRSNVDIGGLQPVPGDPKDNSVAAMLVASHAVVFRGVVFLPMTAWNWLPCWLTEPFVLSTNMAAMPLSFWISRDWLQTTAAYTITGTFRDSVPFIYSRMTNRELSLVINLFRLGAKGWFKSRTLIGLLF